MDHQPTDSMLGNKIHTAQSSWHCRPCNSERNQGLADSPLMGKNDPMRDGGTELMEFTMHMSLCEGRICVGKGNASLGERLSLMQLDSKRLTSKRLSSKRLCWTEDRPIEVVGRI